MKLSVLILAREEAENLSRLLPGLGGGLGLDPYEVVLVDAQSPDGTAEVAARYGARVVQQAEPGYANAFRQGLSECRGDFILTLDADLSHGMEWIDQLVAAMGEADIVVASRYVPTGSATMPLSRHALSVVLNRVYGYVLGLGIRDATSGFRLYRRTALVGLTLRGKHYDVLPELLALATYRGARVTEIPFDYRPRSSGTSKARVLAFAPSYARTLLRCLRARLRPRRKSCSEPAGFATDEVS